MGFRNNGQISNKNTQ